MEKNRQKEFINNTEAMTIGVIGLGNMGSAAVSGLINSGIVDKDHLWVCNRTKEDTLAKLHDMDKSLVTIAEQNEVIVQNCDIVVLSLKQMPLHDELTRWKEQNLLGKDTLLVSFAAGVRIDTLKRWIGRKKQPIARVMPNTPTQSGRGVIGWFINDDASVGQQNMLRNVASAMGMEIQVVKEEQIDTITAISGSGPAYIYRFVEAMMGFAKEQGMTDEQAREIVSETLIGAAIHLDTTKEDVSVLRQKITSKGGTTQKALESFASENIDGIVKHAMEAAKNRAKELGEEFDKV